MINNEPTNKSTLIWKNIFNERPEIGKEVLFIYRDQYYLGSLEEAFLRPIKYGWSTDNEYFNMEELEYAEEDSQPIEFWCYLPDIKTIKETNEQSK